MVRIDKRKLCYCDLCGRRINHIEGRLTLTKRTDREYNPYTTVKSWGICKKCLLKAASIESIGDKIMEEVETKLAEIQIERNPLKLLK